jgi:hypothetical protein
MDRNNDVLYEIILSLIARPTPRGLYNLIAANPAAWTLFQCYPRPLLRRVATLEKTILARLHDAFATSDRAMEAARSAVTEAQAAEGTREEEELITKAADMAIAATIQKREAREALDAAESVLLGTATAVKGVDGNWVVDTEFQELCRQLGEWRGFRTRLLDSAATAASARGKDWEAVCESVGKIVKKHGRDEFRRRWRRALCGLGIGERRSTRVMQRRMRQAGNSSS